MIDSQAAGLRLPKALRPGSRVAMVAPSGSTKDPDAVTAARRGLEAAGFAVSVGESCLVPRYGYLAASDELRAADLQRQFADPAVDGIVCFKGGYGTPRILDRLDYRLIAANPKVFVGYSDITGLHLAFDGRTGFPSFHGPMGMSLSGTLDAFSRRSWLRLLQSTEALGTVELPGGQDAPELGCLRAGVAVGKLTGGNLALVAALCGTPYGIQPDGAIIVLEDIGEEPYRIDRMLTQLRLAGVFDRCAGIVLGSWTECAAADPERSLGLEQVFADCLRPCGKPVSFGWPVGHCNPTISLPFGVKARLDAGAGSLEILEAAAC